MRNERRRGDDDSDCSRHVIWRKHKTARQMLKEQSYIPKMVSKSQFSRRLHRLDILFLMLFRVMGETFKERNAESVYVLDSAPVLVCDNICIKRSKI